MNETLTVLVECVFLLEPFPAFTLIGHEVGVKSFVGREVTFLTKTTPTLRPPAIVTVKLLFFM